MSILILNFAPHEKFPYEELFASLDKQLVLITSKETASTFPKDAFAHVEEIEDYVNNPLIYHRAIQLNKRFSFDKVVAGFEADILMAAKLREYFGIDGQKVNSATNYRDKVIMKEKVSAFGLRVPKFSRIFDVVDLHTFINQNGFPVIIKPTDGFGSIGTTIIHSEKELDSFIQTNPNLYNLEVEEFIKGTLHTVDGIIQEGEMTFVSVTEAVGGNFANLDHSGITGSSQLHPHNPLFNRLTEYCEKVIKALETPENTAFHAEIFYTDDDDIVLCEIASRSAGAHIAQCVKYTYDVDMHQIHVQLQAGAPVEITQNKEKYSPTKLSAWVYFSLEEGTLLSLPTNQPPNGVFEYKPYGEIGQTFSKESYVLTRLAHMLVEGESETELKEHIQSACDWFQSQVKWDLHENRSTVQS